jgi:hypothetical protein
MRTIPLLVAVAVLAAGCGSATRDRSPLQRLGVKPHRSCTHASGGFRACTRFDAFGETSRLYRFHGGRWRPLAVTAPARAGWWRRVVASPDGSTLLLQWSGECEVQSTYLLPERGGRPRAIFRGHESAAIGWRHGDALVRLTEAVWRGHTEIHAPGIYRVDPGTLRVRRLRLVPGHGGC